TSRWSACLRGEAVFTRRSSALIAISRGIRNFDSARAAIHGWSPSIGGYARRKRKVPRSAPPASAARLGAALDILGPGALGGDLEGELRRQVEARLALAAAVRPHTP